MTHDLGHGYPVSAPEMLTRRSFIRRGLLVGGGMFMTGGLLSGCGPFGGDDDDEDEDDDEEEDEPTPDADETPTPEPTPEETPTPEATPTPDPTPTPVPIPDEPEDGGTLVIATNADPWSLHPNADEANANWIVISQIHNALIEVDHNFELVPQLAESFEVAEDASSYTFALREDVLFHNGEEMTSADVVYTHQWFTNPENAAARSFYYERVAEIEATGEYSVVFRMESPDATFLRRAASTYILNEEYHEEVNANGHSLEPIGTGPFVLQDWVRETRITLDAFDDYFLGRPHLDSIEFRITPDATARFEALEEGEVDVAFGLSVSDSLQRQEEGDGTTIQVVDLDCNHVALNNEHPVLSDRNVRLAMLYAIERPPLIDTVYQGAATAATSYLSPALEPWHVEMVEENLHMPDRAVELLEEAGWTEGDDGVRGREGERLSFTCRAPDGGDPRLREAEMISEMLAEVGIEMNVEEAPLAETLDLMREGGADAALFNWTYGGWRGEPDARTTLQTGAFNNFSQFSSIQVDNLLVQGISEPNEDARRTMYGRVQEFVADQAPFLFIMFPHSFYHFGPRVQGLPESANWGSRLFLLTPEFWIFE